MFLNYLIKRLIGAVFVLFSISTLVFLLIHLIPGDPIEVMLGETASLGDREALRHSLGLDLPILQQWWEYLRGILQFDLGESLHSKQAVTQLLSERLPATVILSVASLFVAYHWEY
mgnify:FL=1